MFRENVLVKDDIIDRISETMIPIALNYQKVLDRRSAESRFLRPLMKREGDNQGAWIFTPEGKTLGRFSGFGDMRGKTKRMIEDALETFGPVTLREVDDGVADPDRGKGYRKDGSVRLAEYVRSREQDKIKSPVISSVNLSVGEFAAFAPSKPHVGEQWAVPEPIAKSLCRAASPMCYQHAPQPDWVKDIDLRATVRSIRDGVAELRYEGTTSSERLLRNGGVLSKQELALEGEGLFNIRTGKMESLLIVGSGIFRWPEEAPDRLVAFDSLIEWRDRSSK